MMHDVLIKCRPSPQDDKRLRRSKFAYNVSRIRIFFERGWPSISGRERHFRGNYRSLSAQFGPPLSDSTPSGWYIATLKKKIILFLDVVPAPDRIFESRTNLWSRVFFQLEWLECGGPSFRETNQKIEKEKKDARTKYLQNLLQKTMRYIWKSNSTFCPLYVLDQCMLMPR
jgi:hypothetical protein